jgi:hypothetical protein
MAFSSLISPISTVGSGRRASSCVHQGKGVGWDLPIPMTNEGVPHGFFSQGGTLVPSEVRCVPAGQVGPIKY